MSGAEAVTYQLQAPLPPPEPVPGCATCTDLAKRRARAAADGNYSRVSDCNIWISRHEYHPAIPH